MNHHLPAAEAAFPSAPPLSPLAPAPSSPLLWVPLDEVRQAWASFRAEAFSGPALFATSNAFLALSWETSALRHHCMAHHVQQGDFPAETAALWLDQVVRDLDEAVRDWQYVQAWLERLATSSDTPQTRTEPIEQVRALSEQAVAQQQRLRHLIGQVQHEQGPARRNRQQQEKVPAMAHDPSSLTSDPPTLSPAQRQALRRRIEADLAQIKRCQAGDHRLEATKSPGVWMCRLCRRVGVCLWCGLIPPPGAAIMICPAHHDFVRVQALALGIPLSVLPVPPPAAATSAAGETHAEEE